MEQDKNQEITFIKDIVVIYHAHCYDGFGAAWSAYKKFGDTAQYVPWLHRDKAPHGLMGKEVYVLDFCFIQSITDQLLKDNKLVVIDHHISDKQIVLSLPEHVFSDTASGAKLSWIYFHPTSNIPQLIEYISDSDIWDHKLPHWREVESFIHAQDLTFESFDVLQRELEVNMSELIKIGDVLNRQYDKLITEHVEKAMLISFEGYEVYVCNASSFLRSELGHRLAIKKGPFSIVYRFEQNLLRVSFRGDGSIDVLKIAQKYGGGGHHNAAAIIIENQNPLATILQSAI